LKDVQAEIILIGDDENRNYVLISTPLRLRALAVKELFSNKQVYLSAILMPN